MKEKRYSRRQLVLSALAGFLAALALLTGLLWALLGTQGLALLGGWGLTRALFVGDYEPDTAADVALYGLATGLGDRWSYYVDAEGYQSLKQSRSNTYVGIGVVVNYSDERGLLIMAVRESGPAEKAGLQVGEIITVIDGTELAGEARYSATELIQGRAGTALTATVLGTDGTEREVTITRAAIPTEPVTYELLESGIGYVKLANFNSNTARDFNAAVDDLVEQGAAALVFDMRNNGGGYVDELTKILDHLLPEGPIFRSETRWGWSRVKKSDAGSVDLPMAVLVNGDTYSAAEFFAAQLRESVGAVVVGEPTFGKGFSQQTFVLPNGGALNFSTEKYYTSGGVSLIGTGVTLDAEVVLDETDAALLLAGTLDHDKDGQLQKALELLGK